MTIVFPKNNLPEPAQPWAREVQKQLANVIASNNSNEINNATRDNQLNSSLISLSAAVNSANSAINGLISLGSSGSEYSLNADNINAGTITGVTLQTAASGRRVIISGTSASFYDDAGTFTGDVTSTGSSGSSILALSNVKNGAWGSSNTTRVSLGQTSITLATTVSGGFGSVTATVGGDGFSVDGMLNSKGLYVNNNGIVTATFTGALSASSISSSGTLSVSSSVFFPGLSETTNAANVRVGTGGAGQIFVVTSARKYKVDIQDTELSLEALKLRPRTWIDKGEYERNKNSSEGLTRIPGFVAEEVLEAGLNDFVLYDELGEVQGLSYDRMLASVIPVIKHHNDKIIELNDRITTLENGAN